MADPFPVRPITRDEYAGFRRVQDHAFNSGPPSAARWALALRQFEPDRSLAAFDAALPADEALVGTTGAYGLPGLRGDRRVPQRRGSPAVPAV